MVLDANFMALWQIGNRHTHENSTRFGIWIAIPKGVLTSTQRHLPSSYCSGKVNVPIVLLPHHVAQDLCLSYTWPPSSAYSILPPLHRRSHSVSVMCPQQQMCTLFCTSIHLHPGSFIIPLSFIKFSPLLPYASLQLLHRFLTAAHLSLLLVVPRYFKFCIDILHLCM